MTGQATLRLSVLDLSPVSSGFTAQDALRNTLDLAKLADRLGYVRYWLAEHHNIRHIASAVPEVMIGHVADVTTGIRVGSGGVMLPNHMPLKVAETFRTLEALHPGRIDLGIGRAPGTDELTALALRGSRGALTADDFPDQLDDLLAFFSGGFPDTHPFRHITPMPEGVQTPEIWLLGSSGYTAELAASLGLSFAFAHHINPGPALAALRLYRERFRPSAYLTAPRALLAVAAVCADTDERADELARSYDLTILRLRQGRPAPVASAAEAAAYPFTPAEREQMRVNRLRLFVGAPATVRERLARFAEAAGVSEVMVTTTIHDHQDRRRSYTLLAEAFALSPAARADVNM